MNGHLEYDENFSIDYNVPFYTIDDLKKELNQQQQIFKDWKNFLHKLRMEFYFMTYVPNRKLQQLVKYMTDPTAINEIEIEPIFRCINPHINFS